MAYKRHWSLYMATGIHLCTWVAAKSGEKRNLTCFYLLFSSWAKAASVKKKKRPMDNLCYKKAPSEHGENISTSIALWQIRASFLGMIIITLFKSQQVTYYKSNELMKSRGLKFADVQSQVFVLPYYNGCHLTSWTNSYNIWIIQVSKAMEIQCTHHRLPPCRLLVLDYCCSIKGQRTKQFKRSGSRWIQSANFS